MATVFDILVKRIDIKPEPGESGRDFTIRLSDAIERLDGGVWAKLPNDVQNWYNDSAKKVDRCKALLKIGDVEGADEVDLETVEGFVGVAAGRSRKRPEPAEPADPEPDEPELEPTEPAEPGAWREEPPARTRSRPSVEEATNELRNRGGRVSTLPLDAKITLLTDKNPRRPGTKAAKLFELYKTGVTVGEMVNAGMLRRDIQIDLKNGAIAIEGIDDDNAPQLYEQGEFAAAAMTLLFEGLRDLSEKMLKQLLGHEDRS